MRVEAEVPTDDRRQRPWRLRAQKVDGATGPGRRASGGVACGRAVTATPDRA
jgi:hypothetical protein